MPKNLLMNSSFCLFAPQVNEKICPVAKSNPFDTNKEGNKLPSCSWLLWGTSKYAFFNQSIHHFHPLTLLLCIACTLIYCTILGSKWSVFRNSVRLQLHFREG